jgi:hypothetical protein
LARIILSHALLESIRFVMSRKERRDIYGLINTRIAKGLPSHPPAPFQPPDQHPKWPLQVRGLVETNG